MRIVGTLDQLSPGAAICTWGPLGPEDTAAWIDVSVASSLTAQVGGTFSMARIAFHGSLHPHPDRGDVCALTDRLGNPIDASEAGMVQISENVRWIRPVVIGGDKRTAITVSLMVRTQL